MAAARNFAIFMTDQPNATTSALPAQERAVATLAAEVAARLRDRNWRLIAAESCTGGLLAAALTALPGSSNWFEGSFVTYRLSAKEQMLGVSTQMLQRHGAVSEPVARAMAEGALHNSSADISVSITGIAGPEGGDVRLPVGTVWFGWGLRLPEIQCAQTATHRLPGDRQQIRLAAVAVALRGILELTSPAQGAR